MDSTAKYAVTIWIESVGAVIMAKRWGSNWNGEVKISRRNEAELNVAIADLQARGFEVIRQGSNEYEKKHFDRRHNCLDNRAVFTERSIYSTCWAVLKKTSA